jgi:FMN phosphatase YigB (HAD superfamily)
MGLYESVLFDWMLTLADYPDEREHLRRAHALIGRPISDEELDRIVPRLRDAANDEDVKAACERADCSARLHRAAEMLFFERAALDEELAEAMYGLIGDPGFHPVYPEAATLLEALAERGIRVAVVSDIHVDLRVMHIDTASAISSTPGSSRMSTASRSRTRPSFSSRSTRWASTLRPR